MLGFSLGLGLSQPRHGAASYAATPAPSGYVWDFVTFNGLTVTQNGEPVVALRRV
jgi:hypothetical protein